MSEDAPLGAGRAPSSPWDFAIAIGSVSSVGLASGLTLPLVSVRLTEVGAASSLIAVLSALPAVGTLLAAPALPWLSRLLGPRRLLLVAMLLSALGLLALFGRYEPWLWSSARIMTGAAAAVLFAIGETRILELSTATTRGRWTALYASCLTACQLAGPSLLAVLGVHSIVPLAIGIGLHGLAMLLLLARPWQDCAVSSVRALSLPEFLRLALPLAIAVTFFAVFDSVVLALLPVYGLASGFGERAAVLMASVVLLGDTCLQLPLGWAADRLGRGRVHAACGVLTGLAALLLFGHLPPLLLWPTLFLLGGFAGGIYTLAIVRIGDRLTGPRLLAANGYVSLLFGVGGLAGPLAAGLCMQLMGASGLFLLIVAGAATFMLALACNPRQATLR